MNKDSVIEENYNNWTQSPFDTTTIKNVKSLKNNNPLEFEESFYKNLSFGTGGMRGIVGIEISINEIQCKYKPIQNRSAAEQETVALQLKQQDEISLAEAMLRSNSSN